MTEFQTMHRLLVVDDDIDIRSLLAEQLGRAGYQVSTAGDGAEMRRVLEREHIDLIVLDLNLPREDGLTLCRDLRARSSTPVIMLTARSEPIDRVLGLELGADDYMTKPFSPRELVARVRARLRRAAPVAAAPGADAGWQEHGAFAIDREGRRIRFRGHALDLTRYEYALLEALLQRPGAILSRAQLMDRGWDSSADSADRTVDTHVKTLRAKLRAAGASDDPIRTHRGLGYALEV